MYINMYIRIYLQVYKNKSGTQKMTKYFSLIGLKQKNSLIFDTLTYTKTNVNMYFILVKTYHGILSVYFVTSL